MDPEVGDRPQASAASPIAAPPPASEPVRSDGYARKMKARREVQGQADLHRWYEAVGGADHTFASSMLPLSVGEARAIVAAYHHRYNGRDEPGGALPCPR